MNDLDFDAELVVKLGTVATATEDSQIVLTKIGVDAITARFLHDLVEPARQSAEHLATLVSAITGGALAPPAKTPGPVDNGRSAVPAPRAPALPPPTTAGAMLATCVTLDKPSIDALAGAIAGAYVTTIQARLDELGARLDTEKRERQHLQAECDASRRRIDNTETRVVEVFEANRFLTENLNEVRSHLQRVEPIIAAAVDNEHVARVGTEATLAVDLAGLTEAFAILRDEFNLLRERVAVPDEPVEEPEPPPTRPARRSSSRNEAR